MTNHQRSIMERVVAGHKLWSSCGERGDNRGGILLTPDLLDGVVVHGRTLKCLRRDGWLKPAANGKLIATDKAREFFSAPRAAGEA